MKKDSISKREKKLEKELIKTVEDILYNNMDDYKEDLIYNMDDQEEEEQKIDFNFPFSPEDDAELELDLKRLGDRPVPLSPEDDRVFPLPLYMKETDLYINTIDKKNGKKQ